MRSYNQHFITAIRKYLFAMTILAFITWVAIPLSLHLDQANIVMLFLAAVFFIAFKLGRGPAVMAAFLAVALFDFFFVPPKFSFAVNDVQYLLMFLVMLTVGVATAHLTTMLRNQADEALKRAQDTQRLYELARQLAGSTTNEQVFQVLSGYMVEMDCVATLHLLDANGELPSLRNEIPISNLAYAAINQQSLSDVSQLSDDGRHSYVIPLKSSNRAVGVMLVSVGRQHAEENTQTDKRQFEAIADLVSIAVERLHYVDVAQETRLEANSERLRSSILSALSHDLRTPLTGLVGMADALVFSAGRQDEKLRDSAAAIRDQARTMSNLLVNLLDMARLHAGKVELRKEWQLFEDVIGSAIKLIKPMLLHHPVKVQLDKDLPLVEFDAVLLERVLCNLLENAAKYSADGQPIELYGFVEGSFACIKVRDYGKGFPDGSIDGLFKMFSRGEPESTSHGVGLGLAICKAIIEAHGGLISAENLDDGGAEMKICLPLGTPPEIKPEQESGDFK